MKTFKKGWYSDTKKNLVAFGLRDFYVYDKLQGKIIYEEKKLFGEKEKNINNILVNKEATMIGVFSWRGKSAFYAYSNGSIKKIFEHDYAAKRVYSEFDNATFSKYFLTFTYMESKNFTGYYDYKLTIIDPSKSEIYYVEDFKSFENKPYDERKRVIVLNEVFDLFLKNDEIVGVERRLCREDLKNEETNWFIACNDDLLYGISEDKDGAKTLYSYSLEKHSYKQILKFPHETNLFNLFKVNKMQNELENNEMFFCFYRDARNTDFWNVLTTYISSGEDSTRENSETTSKNNKLLNDVFKKINTGIDELRLYKCNLKTGDLTLVKKINSFPDYEKTNGPTLYGESSYSEDFAVFTNIDNSVSIIDLNNDK